MIRSVAQSVIEAVTVTQLFAIAKLRIFVNSVVAVSNVVAETVGACQTHPFISHFARNAKFAAISLFAMFAFVFAHWTIFNAVTHSILGNLVTSFVAIK